MAFFQGRDVARGGRQDRLETKDVCCIEGRVVIVVRGEQVILIADLVIQPDGVVIFFYHLCRSEDEVAFVPVDWPVGVRDERQVLLNDRVHRYDGAVGQVARARRVGQNR